MMIIDAHVHLPVEEVSDSLQQKKDKLLQEMKKNQVDKCIVISDSYFESTIGSMDDCVKLFKETQSVYVVGGISPLVAFKTQIEKLKDYLDKKLVVGIKLFTGHEEFYLTDESLREVYELAIQYNVPVLFHSGWDHSQYSDAKLVAEVARQYAQLKLICCHCFYPEIEKCQLLVEYSNVYFDISSVAEDETILEDMEVKIKKLIEVVPGRVLFGSDYSGCSQKAHIKFVRKLELSVGVEKKVLYGNAIQVYSIRG